MAARGQVMTMEISITSFFWERLLCLNCGMVNAYHPGAEGQTCACGKVISLWDYLGVSPSTPSYYCCENPKHHRHPDWIEQWEELELLGPDHGARAGI